MYRILFIILFFPTLVFSHELKPSIADFKFKKKNEFLNFNLKIRLNLEAILANIDPSHDDTDESKNKNYYDYLKMCFRILFLLSLSLKRDFAQALTIGNPIKEAYVH